MGTDGVNFDFDQTISREGTASVKYDGRAAYFGTADVTPLWVADMDFAAPPAVIAALAARAAHPIYGYTHYPNSLYDALIAWMRQHHGWSVEREWIVMCPGVVPSLHAAVTAFTRAGEGVIVQPPVYFPFFSAVTTSARRLIENPLRLTDGRYQIDFEHLEQCAANGAKLLLLCSPHNPVGRVWRHNELAGILRIARQYQLVVVSDEIHADLVYPDQRHTVLATLANEADRLITAMAPSKSFNIPGLGLSCLIISNPELRKAMNDVFTSMHVSASNPFSIAAFEAGYRDGGAWLDALMTYLQTTRDFVLDYARQYLPGIEPIAPQGTYLVWLDCRGLRLDDTALRDFFVYQARLGMNPGIVFGTGGSGFMRLNIASPRHIIAAALAQVRELL